MKGRIEILNRTLDDGSVHVGARGAYDPELIAIAKGLGGRWAAGSKTWLVPVAQGPELLRQLEAAGFELDKSLFSASQANKAILAEQAKAETATKAEGEAGLPAAFLAAWPQGLEGFVAEVGGRVAIKTAYLTGNNGRRFGEFKHAWKEELTWDSGLKVWWMAGVSTARVIQQLEYFAGVKAQEIK